MAENIVVTDDQIHDFLKYTLEISNTIYVDENGYARRKETGDQIFVGTTNSNENRPIVLYGSPKIEANAAILNPFVEGMTKSTENEWYYAVLTMCGSNYVRIIQKSLIKLAASMKSKKKKDENNAEDSETDIDLVSILSKWIDKVDETTLKEYDILTKKMSDYFNIYYLPTKKEARVSCGLLSDKDFRAANKKIRVKTWELLEILTKQMFSTTDFSEFTVVSKMVGCPRYDALLRVLYKVYVMLNRYMKYIDDEVKNEMKYKEIDIDYLSKSIDLLDYFRAKAKYLVPAATNFTTIQPQQNPNNVNPVMSLKPSMSPFQNNQPMGMFNSSQLSPVGNMGNSTFMNMGFPGQSMSAPISAMSMRPVAQGSIMPNQFMPNNNFEMKNPFQPVMNNGNNTTTVNIGPGKF